MIASPRVASIERLDDLRLVQLRRVVRVLLGRVLRAPLGDLGEPRRRGSAQLAWTSGVSLVSTRLTSPTIGTSTRTFLPISAGSMSMWTILACGRERRELAARAVVHAHADATTRSELWTA